MSDNIGFLLSDVARIMRRRFDERARDIGVTRPQWRVLVTLARNEGLNQGALAELLEVEPISLCRMVDRLQDAGLVERRADPEDRRAWLIYLTDAARPLLTDLQALGADLFEVAMTGFAPPERVALADLLERVRTNLAFRHPDPIKEAVRG